MKAQASAKRKADRDAAYIAAAIDAARERTVGRSPGTIEAVVAFAEREAHAFIAARRTGQLPRPGQCWESDRHDS